MAELQDFNFKDYRINPTLDDVALLESMDKFPEFKESAGMKIHTPKLIRYIILMYDMNTEMDQHYPQIGVRKRECALMCGFKLTEEGYFHETVEDMLIGENPVVNMMIVRYTRMFANPYYLTYITSWNLLHTEIANSLEPQESKNIATINSNIIKLSEQTENLAKTIFQGDDTKALKKSLYLNMERESLGLRPEEMATVIASGKFIPDSSISGN